jgi:uncharacterized protein (DUF608 family)
MHRRDVISLLGAAGASAAIPPVQAGAAPPWPFDKVVERNRWTEIKAGGFRERVYGCVFDGDWLQAGVPLGGLGTGYMTIEGTGKLGHQSIYNDLVPPKKHFADWLTVEVGTRHVPLSAARIAYWGHHPVADLTADFGELPLGLGLRAFSPLIPGDRAASNTPVALFELELRNTSSAALKLTLHLRFPPPTPKGTIAVRGEGVVANDVQPNEARLTVDVPAGGAVRKRFAVAWYAPVWRDSSSEPHRNRYSQRFGSAAVAAAAGLQNFDAWLRRVLAWQAVIYESSLPNWLRDWLVQSLYSLTKNSVWIARTRKDEWWGEDGWFTHSESHTGCPIVETMVCRMHGHFPLLFLYPELEETTLAAFRHFQISDGEIPFSFGIPTSMRDPRFHCQHPLNSGQYVQMILRQYLRTGDKRQLARFFDSVKRAVRYQYSLDDDGTGLVHDQAHVSPGEAWPANQFYDVWPWEGVSCYVAGTWMATLAAGKALAEAAGDSAFAGECAARLGKAQRTFEERLWNGKYYRLWNNAQAGTTSEVVLANQLMAEWCVKVLGLESVLPAAHVDSALDTVARLNFAATSYGLINGVAPDGAPYDTKLNPSGDHATHIFIGENLCAAGTFLYHGRRDIGLDVARRLWDALAIKTRAPWNQRCLINGQTGLPQWGDDYYSNLAIWTLPMALERQSVGEFTRTGLVSKILAAAG